MLLTLRHIIILALLVVFLPINAQTIKDGEIHFNAERYQQALDIYQVLLSKTPNSASLQYRVARCFLELNKPEQALPLLKYAADKKVSKADYYLGRTYFLLYHFEDATLTLEAYIQHSKDTTALPLLQQAYLGASMLERVEAVVFIDSIQVGKEELLQAYSFNPDLGSLSYQPQSEEACGLSYIFLSGRKNKRIITQSNGAQTDLYQSDNLLNGWSTPTLLSDKINSPMCENYPFVHADGITIYFASQGHESLGGYDIFRARMGTNGDYLIPQNMGMPFNSPYNDYLMIIDDVAQIGWFATDRYQPAGKVMVYQFIPNTTSKNLIQTDSVDVRRQAAQLKSLQLIKNRTTAPRTELMPNDLGTITEFQFIINDSITYNFISDFKDGQALHLFMQAQEFEEQLLKKRHLLDQKRKSYAIANDKERQVLQPDILLLEQEIPTETENIQALYKAARNKELEILQSDY